MKNAKLLNGEEHKIIKEVSKIINSNIVVKCTKCRYCIDNCHQSIDIASIFDIYNKHKMLNISSLTSFGNTYINYTKLLGVGIASIELSVKCVLKSVYSLLIFLTS